MPYTKVTRHRNCMRRLVKTIAADAYAKPGDIRRSTHGKRGNQAGINSPGEKHAYGYIGHNAVSYGLCEESIELVCCRLFVHDTRDGFEWGAPVALYAEAPL